MTFMDWWYSVNVVLKARGQQEMLYGEAKDYWKELIEDKEEFETIVS